MIRKLAAMAQARTVRKAAAELLAAAQLGVGVSSACEHILHEVEAPLSLHPEHAGAQLDFRNAFNLVSPGAAKAVLTRALPVVGPYLEKVYGGDGAPSVSGWAGDPDDTDAPSPTGDGHHDGADRPPAPPPWRLMLPAERGAQDGGPLGPLLHADELWLLPRRLRAAHLGVLVQSFHADIVRVGAPADLGRVMGAAGTAGALNDAELAPAKCVGWSPSGAPAPAGWSGECAAEGVVQLYASLGGPAFVEVARDRLTADQRRLSGAIADRPVGDLQSQLLLLRLCAGPRTNYWLPVLPLAAAARLAAAVDKDAKVVLTGLVLHGCGSPAVVQAGLECAAWPLGAGGWGMGGRTSVAPADRLASSVDALPAGAAY